MYIGLIITGVFSLLLLRVGWLLISIPSIKDRLDRYLTHTESSSWFDRWFLRFRYSTHRKMLVNAIQNYGDKRITGLYKLAGGFFLSIGIIGMLGLVLLAVVR